MQVHTLKDIRAQINDSLAKSAKPQRSLRLLAVSKKQPLEKIKSLYDQGQKEFAESYAQELEAKAEQFSPSDLKWIFIGRLQSNKIDKIVKYSSEIQSVTSLAHAKRIAVAVKRYEKSPMPVYILVNPGSEEQKAGLSLEFAAKLCDAINTEYKQEISVHGIMVLPPREISLEASQGNVPEMFHRLRSAANSMGLGKLSLGMSLDMDAGILAGSDCVRVGTALFGERNL